MLRSKISSSALADDEDGSEDDAEVVMKEEGGGEEADKFEFFDDRKLVGGERGLKGFGSTGADGLLITDAAPVAVPVVSDS